MQPSDQQNFFSTLKGVLDMYGRKPGPEAIALWFRFLEGYPIDSVLAGLHAHVMDPDKGRFAPVPGDVVRHIQEASGTALPARPPEEDHRGWRRLLARYCIAERAMTGYDADAVWQAVVDAHREAQSTQAIEYKHGGNHE